MRVGKRTVKTTHALQRQTDSVNAEGCAVLTRGAPCVNELLAWVRIVSDFCFLLHSSSFLHFQSRSLAARNMPYASGSLLDAWQRALHTGLTIRAARVWPKQDTFRLCFFLQKGPQSLNSTFTWNGYSSMLSQVKTGGKWKVYSRVFVLGLQLREQMHSTDRAREGRAGKKTEHRWGIMSHCFVLLNFSSCKFFKTNITIIYRSQNI